MNISLLSDFNLRVHCPPCSVFNAELLDWGKDLSKNNLMNAQYRHNKCLYIFHHYSTSLSFSDVHGIIADDYSSSALIMTRGGTHGKAPETYVGRRDCRLW